MEVSGESTLARTHHILSLPLQARCDGIAHLVNECSHKELQVVFPAILDSLFGIGNQPEWELRTIFQTRSRDFDSLYRFLHPHGAIFNLIYKLMSDSLLKYEFPITQFPASVRRMLEEGVVPAFYADKLHHNPIKREPCLALNPFEFYMFHFAYHLINPWIVQTLEFTHGETVYLVLSEEYLCHFLPCDGSVVYPPSEYAVKSPLPRYQAVCRPVRQPTIFKQSVLNKANTSGSLHSSPTSPQINPHLEIWRSETIIQAFVELWLSYGSKDATNYNNIRELPPSVDHIRAVRNMLKHFHYFVNSRMGDMSPMDELKRVLWPLTQAKVYSFLRHTIQDWPLDSSFRYILETWLSYIQPWRYTDYRSQVKHTESRETDDRSVDRVWITFIAENLFAYTIIYQILVPRFSRLDLTTPKNAQMLFRVTKVFSQPQLNIMLAEVESCLRKEAQLLKNNPPDICYPLPDTMTGNLTMQEIVRQSPTVAAMGHKWHAFLQQQLQELEGPNFEYTEMFDCESEKVKLLLHMVSEACFTAKLLLKSFENIHSSKRWSFMSMLREAFFSCSADKYDYSLEERKRVVAYLQMSLQQLASIYRVEAPEVRDPNDISFQEASSLLASGIGSMYQSTLLSETSTEERSSMVPQYLKQRRHIAYQGDPDLEPIRSTEFAFLVRILHQLASKLNETYSAEMQNLFSREDFVGNVARQVLCPPLVIRNYDKHIPGRFSTLVETVLPPRLSFRFLARHTFVAYVVTALVISKLLGYTPSLVIGFFCVLWFMYIVLRAICEPLLQRFDDMPHTSRRQNISDSTEHDLSSSF